MNNFDSMIDVIYAILLSFGIAALVGPIFIPLLTRLKFGQNVREEGPKSHLKKSGTPTMGGFIFLIAIVITGLCFIKRYPHIGMILFVTIGFGIIGFIDDYLKILRKRNLGLTALQKIIGQLTISVIFLIYAMNSSGASMGEELLVPFTNYMIPLKVLYIPFMLFVILGTVNGVNLTDGLDGLAANVTLIVAAFFGAASLKMVGSEIAPIAGAVVGSLLGFLIYNSHPAKVFMGDTGSLALGGFVASTAILLKMPLFILIVGFIYLLETVSVAIQVISFKLRGKRVFLMAPIHHHFELKGWKETKIVSIASIVTAILGLISLLAM